MADAFREKVLIDFTHNLAKTVDDVNTQINRLSRTQVNIPVKIGGKGSTASVDREMTDLARKMNSLDFSKGLVKSEISTRRLKTSINDVQGELAKMSFQATNTAKKFGAFLAVSTIFVGVTSSIRDGIAAAIDYEKQMAKIAQVTGNSIKNLGELDREVTRLSTSLGVGSDSIVEVALTLAQAGLSARDTAKALDVLSKTQLSATFDNIKNTTEGAIAIMAQFKTSASDLEGQLSSVNTVAARFAVESSDLVEVIRKSGGAFRATGGELNELLALFTSVRATTRESAESISTGLRTIFTRLQRNRTVNFLGELGIDLRDAKGEFIGIYPAIEKLSKSLENISGTDPRFNQIVEELGGFRQVSKVIPLLKQFETSQKALSVARRAGNSIDRDAVVAQQTLGNQISRVREEFLALTRAYLNDSAFRGGIKLLLDTASALIKVGDAVRPLIPLMGALFATNFVGSGVSQIVQGIKASYTAPLKMHTALARPIKAKPFATGGVVPGSGNGDTVPAMLTPGEFVVRKSAVNAIGVDRLHSINKYNRGGLVGALLEARKRSKAQGLGQLFGGRYQKVDDGSAELIASIKRGFSNPFGTAKGVASGIGGFVGSLGKDIGSRAKGLGLAFQDSLGISRQHPISGGVDFKYNNMSRASLNPKANPILRLNRVVKPIVKPKSIVTMNNVRALFAELERDLGGKFDRNIIKSIKISNRIPNEIVGFAAGTYNPNNKQISLARKDIHTKDQLRTTLFHEFGHGIDRQAGHGVDYASRMNSKGKFAEFANVAPDMTFLKNGVRDLNYEKYYNSTIEKFARNFAEFLGNPEYKKYKKMLLPELIKKSLFTKNKRITKAMEKIMPKPKKQPKESNKPIQEVIEKEISRKVNRKAYKYDSPIRAFNKTGQKSIPTNILYKTRQDYAKKYFDSDDEKFQKAYERINNKIKNRQVGKYRTRNQLLDMWGDLEIDETYLDNSLAIGKPTNEFDRAKRLTRRPKAAKRARRYATGGWVSGSGETDTVPSLLTPGEFVVNKKSAKAFGYDNLNKINKYNKGGAVLNSAALGLSFAPQALSMFTPKQTAQQQKDGDFSFDSLLNGVTAAGAALLIFSLGVKKNTDKLDEAIALTETKISAADRDALQNTTTVKNKMSKADEYNDRKIKAKTDSSKDILRDYKDTTQRRRAEIKDIILKNPELEIDTGNGIQKVGRTKEQDQRIAYLLKSIQTDKDAVRDRLDRNKQSIAEFQKTKASKNAEGLNKLAEFEAQRKATVDPLDVERKKKEAELAAVDRLNNFGEKLSIVSGIAIGVGAALNDIVQRKANAGKRTGITGLSTVFESSVAQAAVYGGGGAIFGGTVGGYLGSLGGNPMLGAQIGAGLGTVGGGIFGGVKGYYDAKSALDAFDINKSFEKLTTNLDNLKSGRATVSSSRSKINSSIDDLEKGFFTFAGSDFDAFKGNVDSSIDGLTLFFEESLKAASSSAEFKKENEKLISVLTRFGGFTIAELEKKIEDEIKARGKSAKIVEDYNQVVLENARRLEGTFLIERGINAAENALMGFGDTLDKTSQILTGSFQSQKTSFNFSALSNIAGSNPNDLARQANQAAGFIGGPATGLAGDVVQAGQLSTKLPSILNDLVFRNQLQGDELLDSLKKQLGSGFASDLVLEAVKKEVGSTGDTTNFLEKFRLNPIEITKTIQESLQGTSRAFAEAMPRIVGQFDEFADGLALARQAFFANLDGLSESINIAQVGAELDYKVKGKPLPFDIAKGFDRDRANLFTEGQGSAELGSRLKRAQENVLRLTDERRGVSKPDDVKNLTKAIEDNVKEVELTTKGLKYLADVNSRLATAEQERARLEQVRESKTNLAKAYLTGGPQERREIERSIKSANIMKGRLARGEDPLAGMSQQMREGGFNILEQFSADGGKEMMDRILKSQGFNLEPNQQEQAVINEEKEIIKAAMDAQDVLNKNLRDNNDKFITDLGTKFDSFFTNLESFFKQEGEKQRETVNNEIKARMDGIQKQVEAIEKAKKTVGLDAKAPLSQLKGSLDIGAEIFNNKEKVAQIEEAMVKLKGNIGNNKNVVDTRFVEELLPVGDERNALVKQIRGIKKAGGTNEYQNQQINNLLQPVFTKEKTKINDKNEELTDRLSVPNVERFVNFAVNAQQILKKAEVGDEDVDKLRKRQEELRNTLRPVGRATGGSVYGARGSDTVPAMTTDGKPYMLTPGEYVMNRSAVQKYGKNMFGMMNKGYLATGGMVGDKPGYKLTKKEQEALEGYARKIYYKNVSKKLAEATAASEQQKKDSYDKKINRVIEDTEWQVRDRPLQEYRALKAKRNEVTRNPSGPLSPRHADTVGQVFFENKFAERRKKDDNIAYHQRVYSERASELRKQGVPGNMIRQTLGQQNRERILQERQQSKGGQSFQNVKDSEATAAQKPQQINPQLMEDFNKVADKLIGAKIAFEITGTVNVNINSSNIGDDITKKFTPVIQEYVNNEIGKAISKFAAANGIPHVSVPVNKGRK